MTDITEFYGVTIRRFSDKDRNIYLQINADGVQLSEQDFGLLLKALKEQVLESNK